MYNIYSIINTLACMIMQNEYGIKIKKKVTGKENEN